MEINPGTSTTKGNDNPREKELATNGKKLTTNEATRHTLATVILELTAALQGARSTQLEAVFRNATLGTTAARTAGTCPNSLTSTEESPSAMPYHAKGPDPVQQIFQANHTKPKTPQWRLFETKDLPCTFLIEPDAEGTGDIEILAMVNGEWITTSIRNVLYSSKLKKNLFSLGVCTEKGYRVDIDKDELRIYSRKDLKAVGQRQDGLYKMMFRVTSSSQGFSAKINNLQLWHERLAHISLTTIREMAKKGLINGLQPEDIKEDDFFCQGCQEGKAHRKPSHLSETKEYNPAPNTTPYELFFGRKVSLYNLKIFGCEAWLHTPKERRRKWDKKSQKMIFLGKISISKDVTFNETKLRHCELEGENFVPIDIDLDPPAPTTEDESPTALRFPTPSGFHPMITRSKKKADSCNYHFVDEPSTYKDAMESPNAEKWLDAMKEEIKALESNNTWSLETLPDGYKPIGSKWVYKLKSHPNSTAPKFKARLVAKGYTQRKNVDYFDTFSPVVRYDSLRVLLANAASERMSLKQFDVKTAFLYGDLDEVIYLDNPGQTHWTAIKNVFRYLKATPQLGILYANHQELTGYSDSAFARDIDSRKSTTGYIFMLNHGAVSWSSQKQSTVALSTTESEYIAACAATKEMVWLRRLLKDIGIKMDRPTVLNMDNQAAIKLVQNPEFHKRTKHIDVRYHYIRTKQEDVHMVQAMIIMRDLDHPKIRSTELFTNCTLLSNDEDKIPTPSLRGLTYQEWRNIFERIVKLQSISEKDALSMIPSIFKGKALEIYASMCQDVFTLGELHQAMNTFFPVSTSGLMKQFWTEKKLPSQPLMDYYFNKLKLAKILNISSEQTLETLSSNVNAKLRPFLIAANPANLDMWIKIASSLEVGFRHEETSSPFNGPRYRRDFQNIDSRNATPSQDSLPSGARPGREVGDRQETRRKQFYQDFRGQGKLMPAFYPEPYTIISIPSPQTIEIDKPCQPENKHATIVNISKVKLRDPVTEDNTEPPFPFQEEEDLEGCLGVEPNKQAFIDSPQVLFSSIKKNPDHPTEPLEKLLLVSVDTQTESEPVVSCEVYQR
ncbi:hypothetical protein LAZ67_5002731 [Cordylochernes scorpioides]|uniref:Polyprotein n=1 Tax=Cordylochernes scorpioides TaxID=51811 RepID=A0ABY6KGM0_9ARAC|nr:hypothetical protein LAZ67_5002731 [Cordylochernes scorpioides]